MLHHTHEEYAHPMIGQAKEPTATCTKHRMRLAASRLTRLSALVHRSIWLVEDGKSRCFIHRIAATTLEHLRYAIERTSSFIKVFFWSRGDPSVPGEVSRPASTINTDNWVWLNVFSESDQTLTLEIFGREHPQHTFRAVPLVILRPISVRLISR